MKTLLDLENNECRFAFGDGPFLFCADATKPGSSYCAEHHAMCFRSVVVALRGRDNPIAGAAIRKYHASTQSILFNDGINEPDFAA